MITIAPAAVPSSAIRGPGVSNLSAGSWQKVSSADIVRHITDEYEKAVEEQEEKQRALEQVQDLLVVKEGEVERGVTGSWRRLGDLQLELEEAD